MKRALLVGLSLSGAALLSGCPIYPEERLFCETSLDCPSGYACDSASGYCVIPSGVGGSTGKSCDEPKDCGFNQTCSSKGQCRTGDCSFHGCVTGYACAIDQGTWTCVAGSGGTGGNDAGADASHDAGPDASNDAANDSASGGSGGSAGAGGSGGSAGAGGSGGSAGATGGTSGDAATD